MYAEGWNACCDAFFGGKPAPEPSVITVETDSPIKARIEALEVDADLPKDAPESDHFIVENAMQHGFEMVNDNGDVLAVNERKLVEFVKLYRDHPIVTVETSAPARAVEPLTLPPEYMLAKLQMVIPLFQEARDALTAITEAQRKLHGLSPTLADRMDEAGTFSLDDWNAAHGITTTPAAKEQS